MSLMRPRHRVTTSALYVGAAILAAVLLAACGGKQASTGRQTRTATTPEVSASNTAASQAGSTTVTVHAQDFSLRSDRQTVPAGPVRFVFVNDSKGYKHELWVYPASQPKLQDMLARKQAGDDVSEEDYLQGLAGHVEDVPPGQTASFDAMLAPGSYELSCFVTDSVTGQTTVHYQMGMHTQLTVQASGR